MRSLGRGFVLVLVGAFLLGVYRAHAPEGRADATLGVPTGTDPVVKAHHNPTLPELVSVRASSHGTFDRVVFTFSGALPASRTGYVRSVRAPGSGRPVPLDGFADLEVSFDARSRDGAGRRTWPGPASLRPGYPSLREVADAGAGAGRAVFGLGLDHRVGFRVLELHRPTRVAIDVAS